jgi:ubiquinone/menaquinone biosynthesis C-methylase UbiE
MTETEKHWNEFYSQVDERLNLPSQFAAFVANEFHGIAQTILDIGCGNGRDANFFASIGFQVIGIDASDEAISNARSRSQRGSVFLRASVSDNTLIARLRTLPELKGNILIYSRFFLHAIKDEDERAFWTLLRDLCTASDIVALEFRTVKDTVLSKATKDHYRRYIDPASLLRRAFSNGFECKYLIEGYGFAKYKMDDAYVARTFFRKI